MKKSGMILIGLMALFLQGVTSQADVVFDFENQTQFESDFPTNSMSLTGTSTASLLSDPGRLYLVATNSAASGSRSAVYSASGYSSELDFVSESKTITFNSLQMETTLSGSTYVSYFGVASEAGQHLPNANDAVYFILSRSTGSLHLMQQVDGGSSTLQTWDAGGFLLSANGRAVTLESLSLTLDGTSWSVAGTIVGETENTPISGSGNLSTAVTAENWGSDFYLGLQAQQNADNAARWTTLTVDSVAVPEPASISLVLVSCAGVAVLRRVAMR